MKQPKTPLPLPPITEDGLSQSYKEVTDNELICQLEKSSKGAHMLSAEKIDFLMSIFDNQKELISKAEFLDGVVNSNVASRLRDGIPSGSSVIKRKSNNTKLATYIVNLFKPLHLLRDFLKTEYEDSNESAGYLTRKATQEQQEKMCKIMSILNKSHELYINLEKDAGFANR